MGFWLELHCDTPPDDRPDSIWVDPKDDPKDFYRYKQCAQESGNHIGILFSSAFDGNKMKACIAKEAKAKGYIKTRLYGWQCPHCVKYRTKFSRKENA